MKILIADKSKTMRTIMRRTLRHAGLRGHEIIEASDGRAALQLILERKPELVLSDWHLPKMDGLECLAHTREAAIRTKFGFVTTSATALFRRHARDQGACFVIGKPFTVDMVEHILAPVLRNGEADVPQDLPPASLRATLRTLCGKPCRVAPATYWDGEEAAVVASYRDEEGAVAGALFAEAGFACSVAAATNLAPPALARHAMLNNVVPGQLRDCVRELANILAGILNQERRHHLVLDDVWLEKETPESVVDVLSGQCNVVTHDVHVIGYTSGRLTLANDLSAA